VEYNCEAMDSLTITVDNTPGCGWHIYNAFSPNGDGDNDVWKIDGINFYKENKIMLFNRWEDKINEFENYDNYNVVWDGTSQEGNKLPNGTYFYIIELPDQTHTGWVQLMRGW